MTTQGDSGERLLHTDEMYHQLWRIYSVKDLCILEAREGGSIVIRSLVDPS